MQKQGQVGFEKQGMITVVKYEREANEREDWEKTYRLVIKNL